MTDPCELGTFSSDLGGGFALPRHYFGGVTISMDDWPAVELSPGYWRLTQIGFPDRHVWIRLKDEFIPWSSNTYTLDWVTRCCFFQNTITLAYVPLDYSLTTWLPPNETILFLRYSIPGFGATRTDNFDLETTPVNFWSLPKAPWLG